VFVYEFIQYKKLNTVHVQLNHQWSGITVPFTTFLQPAWPSALWPSGVTDYSARW